MKKFPKIITSHVLRGTNRDKHGGLYIVDLNNDNFKCVLNWNKKINWAGRGADRGLRGLVLYKDNIIVASSSSILFYDLNFKLKKTYVNEYLQSCHEIFIYKNILYMASTARDIILCFDLINKKFIEGIFVRSLKNAIRFNPLKSQCLKKNDTIHMNNVFVTELGIFFSGTNKSFMYLIKKNKIIKYATIPKGTHNCQLFSLNKIIMNDTKNNRISIIDNNGKLLRWFDIKKIPLHSMKNFKLNSRISRQPFGRGLAIKDNWLIGGSTPGMISLYDSNKKQNSSIKNIIISNDLCMSIHGLEVWPY